ncbi:flagellar hook assembly protein FlgD [Stutzerimonas azotifigens]|uniref:flagellar hook assembly protein FlgD n=1 Tax=Stutzerimonas azotifigens TaxID=291995 RepID=UPI0004080CDC|nr:flagellar hook assembly protein FlgD [Stutzerimonas azotifigens]
MSTVDSTTSASILSQYAYEDTSSKSSSSDALGKDTFLQLLVTQLNNQNPLDPQDNSEFVSQLAQFSSLESMQNLTDTVGSFYGSYQSMQALQASSLVGRSVVVNTDSAQLEAGGSISGSLVMPSSGSNVTVGVYDASGEQVTTLSLGTLATGEQSFTWNGTDTEGNAVAAGSYTILAAASIGGENTALTTYLPAKVSSVTLDSSGAGMTLNLAGLGSVSLSDIKTIAE